MTENQNRQPEGIPTGGQYAATAHSDQVPALAAPAAPAGAAGIIAEGTYPVLLRFVDYDDKLTKEQIGMILSCAWSDAENDVEDRFSDHAYEEAVKVATEELKTAVQEGRFDREWDELHSSEQDKARYALEERDDSDPVKDLLRNTPPQLMRTSLGQPAARLSEPRFASGHHRTSEASKAAKRPQRPPERGRGRYLRRGGRRGPGRARRRGPVGLARRRPTRRDLLRRSRRSVIILGAGQRRRLRMLTPTCGAFVCVHPPIQQHHSRMTTQFQEDGRHE